MTNLINAVPEKKIMAINLESRILGLDRIELEGKDFIVVVTLEAVHLLAPSIEHMMDFNLTIKDPYFCSLHKNHILVANERGDLELIIFEGKTHRSYNFDVGGKIESVCCRDDLSLVSISGGGLRVIDHNEFKLLDTAIDCPPMKSMMSKGSCVYGLTDTQLLKFKILRNKTTKASFKIQDRVCSQKLASGNHNMFCFYGDSILAVSKCYSENATQTEPIQSCFLKVYEPTKLKEVTPSETDRWISKTAVFDTSVVTFIQSVGDFVFIGKFGKLMVFDTKKNQLHFWNGFPTPYHILFSSNGSLTVALYKGVLAQMNIFEERDRVAKSSLQYNEDSPNKKLF